MLRVLPWGLWRIAGAMLGMLTSETRLGHSLKSGSPTNLSQPI